MEVSIHSLATGIDTVWVLLCSALVFLMEGGFAALEAGFIRSKNSLNVVMKVLTDCTAGMLGYYVLGFGIMYGLDVGHFMGWSNFLVSGSVEHLELNIPVQAFWLFQAGFAMAMATIVSGAVAGRMKFAPYIVFSALASIVIYPISGHWVWSSEGWLNRLGMVDFAGSAAVHALGGWASLAAVLVLGPRSGKYNDDGSDNVIPGHNLPLAALGAFLLWFGWFGFNPGSTLSGLDGNIAIIAMNTNLAAAAGGMAATLFTMMRYGKADPSMAINGALGGLVAITAGCASVDSISAIIIGLIAGILIVLAVPFFDRFKADDPVGAISVHGVCGTFGTIAVGLFSTDKGLFFGHGSELLLIQTLGVVTVSLWGFAMTYGVFWLLKQTVGIRVSREDEQEGLDYSEHGMSAYNDLEFNPLPAFRHAESSLVHSLVKEDLQAKKI